MQSGNDMFVGYDQVQSTVPAGSRLAQYLHGTSTQSSTRPIAWDNPLVNRYSLNPPYSIAAPNPAVPTSNVPSFVQSFAQLNLGGDKDLSMSPYSMASSSQRSSNFATSSSHGLTSSPAVSDSLRSSGHVVQATDTSPAPNYMQENFNGTTYFFPQGQNAVVDQQRSENQEDHVHIDNMGGFLYRAPPPNVGRFKTKGTTLSTYFTAPELRYELISRQLAISSHADVSAYPDLPQNIEQYHELVPLENNNLHFSTGSEKSVFGNHATTVYKAINARDGMPYCIRRIHNVRITQPKQITLAENWKKLVQVNVVQLRDVLITKQFGDTSLLFVYDYHPMSETLRARHFDNQLNGLNANFSAGGKTLNALSNMIGAGVQESVLWTYVVQLSSALRTIHGSGMAARTIDLTKIIVFSKTKLMLSSCGILDVIAPDSTHNAIQHQQQEDLIALGRLLAVLACNSPHAARREMLPATLQIIQQHYSNDMKNLIALLLNPGNRRNINEIMPMIGARFYNQVENMQVKADLLENELSKELENGRLFRLLCKICCIIDRPDIQMGMAWSETGDRFLLKLFREYLFHQVTENGKPWIDMAHIITCLNKLDAGYPEKIQLVSSDGDNVLIVSYGELKQCVENSFRELTTAAAPSALAPLIPIVGPR
uniref:PAN2-PAN3 deadenylation complex subunit PAN3 n=1 Tax=Syphacia muris TaxID=451379 RepID=A0A0N5A8J3_9BILA